MIAHIHSVNTAQTKTANLFITGTNVLNQVILPLSDGGYIQSSFETPLDIIATRERVVWSKCYWSCALAYPNRF